jgi:ribosomal protein L11 methyltransferase
MKDSLWRLSLSAHREAEPALSQLVEQQWKLSPVRYFPEESDQCSVWAYAEVLPDTIGGLRKTVRQAAALLEACGLFAGPIRCSIRRIRREDWAESWKRHFKPFAVGRKLLLKPSWNRKQPRRGQSVVELDPGLSFGTGQHPTTRFCLDQMARLRTPNRRQSLLDIGTGSGILAIAAAKLGYGPVRAFDFDPIAVQVARRNVRLNQVQQQVRVSRENLSLLPLDTTVRFEVVCANLEYDLLLAESQRIVNRLTPGGFLLLAGILERQYPSVSQTYQSQGLRWVRSGVKAGWHSGLFVYPADSE